MGGRGVTGIPLFSNQSCHCRLPVAGDWLEKKKNNKTIQTNQSAQPTKTFALLESPCIQTSMQANSTSVGTVLYRRYRFCRPVLSEDLHNMENAFTLYASLPVSRYWRCWRTYCFAWIRKCIWFWFKHLESVGFIGCTAKRERWRSSEHPDGAHSHGRENGSSIHLRGSLLLLVSSGWQCAAGTLLASRDICWNAWTLFTLATVGSKWWSSRLSVRCYHILEK